MQPGQAARYLAGASDRIPKEVGKYQVGTRVSYSDVGEIFSGVDAVSQQQVSQAFPFRVQTRRSAHAKTSR